MDKTAYVTQNSQVFMASILENMLLGNYLLVRFIEQRVRAASTEEEKTKYREYLLLQILDALQKSRSLDFIGTFTSGLNTVLGDRVPYHS